ncbi:EAL domain-containing protein [Pseudoxanthomonas sp. UTMC 1351]|uniref:EAL domain-containing protein n=1 Tax=Pseudoxanthomonas sp. UTMC 1351 TaxID=2695853 RepID=UPI0034CEA890
MHSELEPLQYRLEETATQMDGIVAAALVRRGGLQIGMLPEYGLRHNLRGGAITVELLHPAVGRLDKSHFASAVHDAGLEWLLFCRSMVRILTLQRRLLDLGRPIPCTVDAPQELLLNDALRRRCAAWVADSGLVPACIRLRFSQRQTANWDIQMLHGARAIQERGFGIAFDLASMTGIDIDKLDISRSTILVGRAVIAMARRDADCETVLREKLEWAMANGAQAVACGIASPHCVKIAMDLGFKLLQGRQFPLPLDVAQALTVVNAH